MNGASDLVADQRGDHSLDLPPVAKVRDIAVVARRLCPRRSLEARAVAEPLDELRRVSERQSSMDEGDVHPSLIARQAYGSADEHRQRGVDYSCAIGCGVPMNARTTQAGGFFLTISILAGFAVGIAIGNSMKGGLIGTATGVILAVLLWLIDRQRR